MHSPFYLYVAFLLFSYIIEILLDNKPMGFTRRGLYTGIWCCLQSGGLIHGGASTRGGGGGEDYFLNFTVFPFWDGYYNYLEEMYTKQNDPSFFSQSGTHSQTVWLMCIASGPGNLQVVKKVVVTEGKFKD